MKDSKEHLEAIQDIRSMMERSSRFVSLSGLAGIFVGVFALCGAWAAKVFIETKVGGLPYYEHARDSFGTRNFDFYLFFFADALAVLVLSLLVSSLLTMRKAKKAGLNIWDSTARRLFINMMIPLASGGLFCLLLIVHHHVEMVAPAMLIFYGLALVNSSKYTFEDIRYLGLCEIILGLLAGFYVANGLLFWALGFGVLHIIYGILMYNKYDRKA